MKILFLDSTDSLLSELLTQQGHQLYHDYESPKEEIEKKISAYDGIVIRSRFKIDKQFIDAANLKFIARVGAGMENMDVDYAESKGVKCLSAPEGNCDAVAEHAIAMLLNLLNKGTKADNEVRQGIWKREENRGFELGEKTIGIIGFGNIGKAVAKKLSGFDVTVLAYDKYLKNYSNSYAKESTMEELFDKCDILSLHIPITPETANLVTSNFLNKFKKNIVLINTARGKVVNTADLVANLKSGKVVGACLDVLEYEASSFENVDIKNLPEPFQYLTKSNNVILSPHIAGWTFESNTKMAKILAEKIGRLN